MAEQEIKKKLNDEIKSIIATITNVHREDYIKHAIDTLMKYVDILTTKEIAKVIEELFFIGTIDPSILEGHPTLSTDGPARALFVLEDEVENLQDIIEELRDITPDLIEAILIELDDYIEGIFDGFGI